MDYTISTPHQTLRSRSGCLQQEDAPNGGRRRADEGAEFPGKNPGTNCRQVKAIQHCAETDPIPSTLGSLVQSLEKTKTKELSTSMTSRMNTLLRESGLGNLRAATEADVAVVEKDRLRFAKDEDEEDDRDGDAPQSSRINVGYMTKLKSMMSYEIAKRKRLNKIKSKTYRRILRKEKDRDQERRQKALELLNPDAARARLQEKMEKLRAEERATQKHKNTSKWVKHAKAFAKFDDDTKDAIQEQHNIRQRLMAKMEEEAGAERAAVAEEMSASSEEDLRVDELLAGERNAESALWKVADDGAEAADHNSNPVQKARSELQSMGFMQKAKERSTKQLQKEAAMLQEDVDRYRKHLQPLHAPSGMLSRAEKKARNALEDEEDDNPPLEGIDGDDDDEAKIPSRSVKQRSNKRDGPGRTVVSEGKHHRDVDVALKSRKGISAAHSHSEPTSTADMQLHHRRGDDDDLKEDAEETWADPASSTAVTSVAPIVPPTAGFAGDRKTTTTTKRKSTSHKISILPTKRDREEAPTTATDNADQSSWIAPPPSDYEKAEVAKRDLQEYLISRAFANDEVDEDFLKAKEAQVESVMKPVDKNATLPGWGEWGGENERLNIRHKTKLATMQMDRNIQKSALMKARADADLDNVIINHDVDLVPDRQTLHMVPRPFSNPVEYARSMRQPVGPEWNSSLSFKEATQPRITTTQGVAIEPLDLATQRKKAKTVRRKLAAKKKAEK
jgi:U3 small nucleolar RNA-associated protein 14